MMLQTRVIPCLLLDGRKLVKTIRFSKPNYIGDPINAVKIFNDKEVDELVFLDINASKNNKEPNYALIQDIASECFMPFGYGGGVDSVEKAKRILKLGAEKIIINSSSLNEELLKNIADQIGSQSLVISIDIKKNMWGKQSVFLKGGTVNTKIDPVDFAKYAEENGAGELFINSIDLDGTMKGYDKEIINLISKAVNIPVVACGGASNLDDMVSAIDNGASAVAAGSLFVYHGPHKAVLINYPSQEQLSKYFVDRFT